MFKSTIRLLAIKNLHKLWKMGLTFWLFRFFWSEKCINLYMYASFRCYLISWLFYDWNSLNTELSQLRIKKNIMSYLASEQKGERNEKHT